MKESFLKKKKLFKVGVFLAFKSGNIHLAKG